MPQPHTRLTPVSVLPPRQAALSSLVYFSFQEAGSEYVQSDLGYSVIKNALKFGRKL